MLFPKVASTRILPGLSWANISGASGNKTGRKNRKTRGRKVCLNSLIFKKKEILCYAKIKKNRTSEKIYILHLYRDSYKILVFSIFPKMTYGRGQRAETKNLR